MIDIASKICRYAGIPDHKEVRQTVLIPLSAEKQILTGSGTPGGGRDHS
jgi:hypothetical protein